MTIVLPDRVSRERLFKMIPGEPRDRNVELLRAPRSSICGLPYSASSVLSQHSDSCRKDTCRREIIQAQELVNKARI